MNLPEDMTIARIVNNNIVVVLDARGREQVVTGRGLGFGRKTGDCINREDVEKIFVLQSDEQTARLGALLSEVSPDIIAASEQIITLARQRLGRLQDSIWITLTDHLNFAAERYRKGVVLRNVHQWEACHLYPKEFGVALDALGIIEKRLGLHFTRDEAGFISLHLVAAQLDNTLSEVPDISRMMQEILSLVKYRLNIDYDENSLSYQRFITHLKFFSRRIIIDSPVMDDDTLLHEAVKDNYPQAWQCAEKIALYLVSNWQRRLTTEEMMFLAVHIERVRRENGNK
jgi:beta-glucoside operon transcriptional antiterminator